MSAVPIHCLHCDGQMPGVTITSADLGQRYSVPRVCPHCGSSLSVEVRLTLFTIAPVAETEGDWHNRMNALPG